MYKFWVGLFLCAAACYGQRQWEFGGTFGYGWNRGAHVNGPGGEAKAGLGNQVVAGAVVGEDLYEHIAGEIRYLYQAGDPYLSNGGRKVTIQGQSHTLAYDLLFHLRGPESRLRPFVAVGAGGKYYKTDSEPATQPLSQFGSVIQDSQWKLVLDWGVGVKYRVREHLLVRADFRHYITPFPRAVIVPATNGSDRGLFQQFTPMLGVSYWF